MPIPHTSTDSPPGWAPSAAELKLTWQFDGERLTCRWTATSAEESIREVELSDVA